MIDRSDAVVLGRVLDAGYRELPGPEVGGQRTIHAQGYARIAVEHWILGPDTDEVVEVRLSEEVSPSLFLTDGASHADKRVVVYLCVSHGIWGLVRDISAKPGQPLMGLEVLSPRAALGRIPAIRAAAKATSPESLAVRADVAVVGTFERFTVNPPGMACHVERVVSGMLSSSEITVVMQTPSDMRLGEALLLLERRPDSTWRPLDDGAGCYYLDQERLAHLEVPAETLFARVAAAHARRSGMGQR